MPLSKVTSVSFSRTTGILFGGRSEVEISPERDTGVSACRVALVIVCSVTEVALPEMIFRVGLSLFLYELNHLLRTNCIDSTEPENVGPIILTGPGGAEGYWAG
jgi:hypothetical protein